jgi:prepilin-type N-terminal cleavage/methylation domain-containing protein
MVHKSFLKKQLAKVSGFTLIETVTVISIIGLLTTIAFPAFNSTLNNHKLATCAATIASDIRLIQQKTVTEGIFYRLKYDPYAESYSILTGSKEEVKKLPEGINLVTTSFANHTFGFSLTGAPTPAGTVIIKNSKGNHKYIIVALATGRVRISDTPPESWE